MTVFKSHCTKCKRELYRRPQDQWVDTVDRRTHCPGGKSHWPGAHEKATPDDAKRYSKLRGVS